MKKIINLLFLPVAIFLAQACSELVSSDESMVEDWREDLSYLVQQIEQIHPNLYHSLNRDDFQESYNDLYNKIPTLTEDQVIVEVMELIGLFAQSGKEGHSGVYPQAIFGMLPILLYNFEDGWFIVDANAKHSDLIGAQVLALGGTPIDEVVQALSPLIATDNDTNLLIKIPRFLVMPGLLSALGLSPDRDAMALTLLLSNGDNLSQLIESDLSWQFPFFPPEDQDTIWLSNTNSAWWIRTLEDNRTLYVQYNRTFDVSEEDEPLESLATRITEMFDENNLERVVLDTRLNGGGDNTTFMPLVSALKNHQKINSTGSLYALIGRGTFSAAGNFITVLEQETNVILVGEPTGGGPNQFGDAVNVVLPNHPDLTIRIATAYHEFDSSNKDRLTHQPHINVGTTSREYFMKLDPVLEQAMLDVQ